MGWIPRGHGQFETVGKSGPNIWVAIGELGSEKADKPQEVLCYEKKNSEIF